MHLGNGSEVRDGESGELRTVPGRQRVRKGGIQCHFTPEVFTKMRTGCSGKLPVVPTTTPEWPRLYKSHQELKKGSASFTLDTL